MNLFEWNKLTEDWCPICRSRLFDFLSKQDKDELIDSVSQIHELYDLGDDP